MTIEMYTRIAVQCLKTGLQNVDEEQEESTIIRFVMEQLQLAITNKFCRHYSPQLTVFCYMLNAAISSAYSFLRDEKILCVPSVNTLRKVSRRLSAANGLDNASYLKLRVSKLNEFERNTVLIIDEIYVAKRVEYSGGEMTGLTCDGVVASTLLCFMAKSIVSKYKDIISIYPVHKLTADKLHQCYLEVMALLKNVSLNVVAISVDNAATNRKFLLICFVLVCFRHTLQMRPLASRYTLYSIRCMISKTCTTTFVPGMCLSVHQWTEICQTNVLQSLITSWGYTTQSQPCR